MRGDDAANGAKAIPGDQAWVPAPAFLVDAFLAPLRATFGPPDAAKARAALSRLVSRLRLRAAATLGASRLQTLLTVIFPSTVPYMVTGARLAMGNSFLTIVSAEIVAAQVGLGSMIWTSRNYGKTEWVFVGIITLGLLGYVCDRVVRFAVQRLLRRYAVAV